MTFACRASRIIIVLLALAVSGCAFNRSCDQMMMREISETVDMFCHSYSPPSPERGYGWDFQAAWSDLRDSLIKHHRIELVESVLMKRIEVINIDNNLRETLLGMILLLRRKDQESFDLRMYANAAPDVKSIGLIGMARRGDRKAFAEAVSLVLGAAKWQGQSDVENVKTGLEAIDAYFGYQARWVIPSQHWDVWYRDYQPDDRFIELAGDFRAWWQINKEKFEKD